MIWKLLSIASGGAVGALMRFGVSYFTSKNTTNVFPTGTFIANLLGALLIGFFWGFFEKTNVSSNIKSFVLIGVIGSFTTFSTLSLETVKLFQQGNEKLAILYISLTNIFGIALVIIGFFIAKQIFSKIL